MPLEFQKSAKILFAKNCVLDRETNCVKNLTKVYRTFSIIFTFNLVHLFVKNFIIICSVISTYIGPREKFSFITYLIHTRVKSVINSISKKKKQNEEEINMLSILIIMRSNTFCIIMLTLVIMSMVHRGSKFPLDYPRTTANENYFPRCLLIAEDANGAWKINSNFEISCKPPNCK